MTIFEVDVDVNPVPLGRPRTVPGRDGRTVTFTPGGSRDFKDAFRLLTKSALARSRTSRPFPLDDDLALRLGFWRHHRGSNRGDLDNLVKAVLDAGNRLLWNDDEQIVELHARIEAHGPHVHGHVHLAIHEPAF